MPLLLALVMLLFSAMILLAVLLTSPVNSGALFLCVLVCMAYHRWSRYLERKERHHG